MKHLIILTTFTTCIVWAALSQPVPKNSELQLYIAPGVKFLQPKYFGHTVNISPATVPSIGSGIVWQMKKFQLGGEFNYTDGQKQTAETGTIFTGINVNVIGGYCWSLGKRLNFNIQTGFGYHLFHLSMTDKNYNGSANLNTAIYHNYVYTVPVSATLQKINANGTFIGMRAGYHFTVMPNEWRYIQGTSTQVFTTKNDGFYLQLLLGGLIKLKQSHL